MIIVLALLNAGLAKADDYAATNRMPVPIHILMESEGYNIVVKTNLDLPAPDTNSIRYLQLVENPRLIPLKPPEKKTGWSFWNNTSIKYVGQNADPVSIFAPSTLKPYTALSQYEYDITYSFDF
jgi:hypothetical protein